MHMTGASPKGSPKARNTATRLAAVQILYQLEINPSSTATEETIKEFLTSTTEWQHKNAPTPDRAFLQDILFTIQERSEEIDQFLEDALRPKFTLKRFEPVIRSIFRAAVSELLTQYQVPAKIILNDYVSLGYDFGEETGLINGVLDKVARRLRAAEFDA